MSTGALEAVTNAVGFALNEFGGLRMTRLLSAASVGATTLTVERSYGWPNTGRISVDGAIYHYTGNGDGTLTGIYYLQGGGQVPGTKIPHNALTAVIDVSQTYSGLDLLRQALFVGTAQGDDLSVIARNLGVPQFPDVTGDTQLRGLIEAMAYNPKGTIYGLTILLNALVGPGNWSIYEDPVSYPCEVFIVIPGSLFFAAIAQGKAYLYDQTVLTAVSGAFSFTAPAQTYPYVHVAGILLKDDHADADCRLARPSIATPAWIYVGASETSDVHIVTTFGGGGAPTGAGDGTCQIVSTATSSYYKFLAQLRPESLARVRALVDVPAAAQLNSSQCLRTGAQIQDGVRKLAWGATPAGGGTFTIGLTTNGTTLASPTTTLNRDQFYDVVLEKQGQNLVNLYVDSLLVASLAYASFPTTSAVEMDFGILSNTSGQAPQPLFKGLSVLCHTDTDYWNAQGTDGSVASGSPHTLSVASNPFLSGDVGKQVRITGSTATNSHGGNNNCVMRVLAYVSSGSVTLQGPLSAPVAQVNNTHPTRITVNNTPNAFRYPDDLGKAITITNSSHGNNGAYTIARLLDPNTLVDLSTFATHLPSNTNVCEVVTASFLPETGLIYYLMPQFVTESSLAWELSDAGTLGTPSGTVYPITTRQALPFSTGTYVLLISTYLSAQILADESVVNAFVSAGPPAQYTYWPFYLADPFNFIEEYINLIVAAGIKPVFVFT